MKRRLIILCAGLLLLTVAVTACTGTDKISDILANPEQYTGKEVNVKGYVGSTIWLSLISRGAYQVNDGSGSIWVTTSQPPPQQGVSIRVKGTVEPAVTLGESSLGTVIVEAKRD